MTTKVKGEQSHFRRVQGERVWVVALLCLWAVLYPVIHGFILESRTLRDLFGITPFHSVILLRAEVSEGGDSILLEGSMIKRRCAYLSASAYTERGDVLKLASLDFSPEGGKDTTDNRMPSDAPQAWWPWRVTTVLSDPERVLIYIRHNCPNEPLPQGNLFLDVEWAAYPKGDQH